MLFLWDTFFFLKKKKKKKREIWELIEKYAKNVKEWSWCAILQEPELVLTPNSFRMDGRPFDEEIHKKFHTSARDGTIVSYCVWPALSQNGVLISDLQIEVVVKNLSTDRQTVERNGDMKVIIEQPQDSQISEDTSSSDPICYIL
ncbi:hypothetical protein RFI_24766 [Reticulomyxa filosa]|uniref:Mitochondria-eating protein C-terminal domain-containing protein n=1 Tax=Reticulomyxa filosa TaxID=46433 RepID=X6MHR1_RETFI|nr:hypothetical protein RFI_24766 [Reticulomyxa filosa]|eukprot:ETO12610.1 hypothetical protein RFI_24766 [Reticulomyxa filosa]